jgi:hypothetical protein
MSIFTKLAQQIFAPVDENGNPRAISEQEVGVWGTEVEALVNAFVSTGGLIYASKAALDADLAKPANTMAWVMGDPVAANNGIYGKVGASGGGSWARRGDLPFSFIIATNAGAGTPNAIQATTSIPASNSALIWMNIAETNTGSPVTVSFNGGSALTIKTNSGNDPAPGGLVAGMIVLGVVAGSMFRLVSDQASAAIVALAEAAAAAAEAAAASIIDKTFVSVAQASTATIDFNAKRLATQFYSPLFADLTTLYGGAAYRRARLAELGSYPPSSYFRSADRFMPDGSTDSTNGGYWLLDEVVVNPYMFGALRGRSNSNDTTSALQAMFNYCGVSRAGYDLLGGSWFISGDGLVISQPVKGVGRGAGYWHPKPPNANDGLSTIAPTQIVATGIGNRVHSVHGVSSMRVSGGVVTNPSAATGYNDTQYSLTSFMNPVSDGASARSPRMFSAALWVKPTAASSDLSGFRLITDGGGDDGMDLWLVPGNSSTPWAADWDCGIVLEMACDVRLANADLVGHWRMYAELVLAIPANPSDPAIPAIFGAQHANCTFAGRVGVGVRGADMWKVTAVGADWLEFDWADDHPFDASVFNRIGYGNGSFTLAGNTTFAGQSKVAGKLRLTGVASTAAISVGDQVTTRVAGGGTSHLKWDHDCRFNGIHHTSGRMMHDQALGANSFSSPSAVIEVSGWRCTELQFFGAVQTIEEVALQAHAMSASVFVMDWEANASADGKTGARIITSPHEAANTRVTNPAGKTQYCVIDSVRGARNETGIDFGPRYTANAPSVFGSDTGLMEGFDLQTPSLLIDAHGDNGTGSNPTASGIRTMIGMLAGILGADGAPKFVYSNEDDKLFAYEHLFPDSDNMRDLGDSSHRFRSIYALQYRFAGGANFISAGVGSPEGAVTGPVGSLYLNLSGGVTTTLYVKTSGTGNTGWTAK